MILHTNTHTRKTKIQRMKVNHVKNQLERCLLILDIIPCINSQAIYMIKLTH